MFGGDAEIHHGVNDILVGLDFEVQGGSVIVELADEPTIADGFGRAIADPAIVEEHRLLERVGGGTHADLAFKVGRLGFKGLTDEELTIGHGILDEFGVGVELGGEGGVGIPTAEDRQILRWIRRRVGGGGLIEFNGLGVVDAAIDIISHGDGVMRRVLVDPKRIKRGVGGDGHVEGEGRRPSRIEIPAIEDEAITDGIVRLCSRFAIFDLLRGGSAGGADIIEVEGDGVGG